MATSVKVDATDFLDKFARAQSLIFDNVKDGLNAGADEILRRSSREAPLDVGTLKDSGKVVSKSDFEVEITYNTPYAEKVHEGNFNFQHGRKNKYLEDPFREFAPSFARWLVNRLAMLLR